MSAFAENGKCVFFADVFPVATTQHFGQFRSGCPRSQLFYAFVPVRYHSIESPPKFIPIRVNGQFSVQLNSMVKYLPYPRL